MELILAYDNHENNLMKNIFWILLIAYCSMLTVNSQAQVSDADLPQMKIYEDSLKELGDSTLNAQQQVIRQTASWEFIRTLKKALLIDGSFEYPFDSLSYTAIQYPEDKSFRIFTWRVQSVDGSFHFYGCIQKKDLKKNEPKFYPLFDHSGYIKHPMDTILNNECWYGSMYYKIMKSGKYYLLFGFDQNNPRSNRKVVDVLTFDKTGTPIFGAPIFNYVTEKGDAKVCTRFMIEYKKDAKAKLSYDTDYEMIIFDHLIPQTPLGKGLLYTYIPDGTYEGFEFKKGKWNYVSKVFDDKNSQDDINQAPIDFDSQNKNFGKGKKNEPPK